MWCKRWIHLAQPPTAYTSMFNTWHDLPGESWRIYWLNRWVAETCNPALCKNHPVPTRMTALHVVRYHGLAFYRMAAEHYSSWAIAFSKMRNHKIKRASSSPSCPLESKEGYVNKCRASAETNGRRRYQEAVITLDARRKVHGKFYWYQSASPDRCPMLLI